MEHTQLKRTLRYFVALGAGNMPVSQRSTLRSKPYLSASMDGASYSSKPPHIGSPLMVIEVSKPLEWVARATLADGTKVTARSRAFPPGRNFVRYEYSGRISERWINGDGSAYQNSMSYKLVEFAAGTVELLGTVEVAS
jgi:hypothetical protein